MEYAVTLERFKGPLDKLLELVQKQQLDINHVSLAEVTGGFLSFIAQLEKEKISNAVLADFLVIASKLLLIKSKMLIPALVLDEEEEQDIRVLEIQLKIYQKIKEAQYCLKNRWKAFPLMGNREFLMNRRAIFYPPSITPQDLAVVLVNVTKEIEKFRPIEAVKTEVINLQNKIKEVLQRITKEPVNLAHLSNKGSRKELITLFLAVLHLLKDELVSVEQNASFGDIVIAKKQNIK